MAFMPSEPELQDAHRPPVAIVAAQSKDNFATELRGFGPIGVLAMLVILLTGNLSVRTVMLPAGALLTLAWMRLSHTPWPEIGYVQPKSWIRATIIGIGFGASFKLLMKAIVMPLLAADPLNHAYHYLAGNKAALPAAVWMMFAAGFGEETVYRGYMFERLGKLFRRGTTANVAMVLITSLWFGVGHYASQGLAGAEQAMIVGVVYGTIYASTRSIFMLMCAHTAFDLTALAIIYWNVESRVAHLVFR